MAGSFTRDTLRADGALDWRILLPLYLEVKCWCEGIRLPQEIPQLMPRTSKLNLLPLGRKTVWSPSLSVINFNIVSLLRSVNMWQSTNGMRPPVHFVTTMALKGVGTILLSATSDRHVQNALVVCILTKLRMAVVLTNWTVRNSTTKVTTLQLPSIPVVTREWIQAKLQVLIQTNLNQHPYHLPVCLPQKHKFCWTLNLGCHYHCMRMHVWWCCISLRLSS